ncbi:copper chaperone PCu(A)C [Paucibacter sp. KCTC 42545]|uniref:copper chaperone PCu(A)C n=1 Tax=Paucibacter sp. KCTC 42545 TaxID=1768242 RepID=UPI000A7FABCF|nr:copper chaperone PCu(A)C [Paucibacter sp. KCTC 42545]
MPLLPALHRRALLQASLASGLSLVLGRPAQACEFFTTTLRVTHPWTRASKPGASTAIVCMRFDEVTVADRLIRVSCPLASGAEIGGHAAHPKVDFLIPAGQESVLSEEASYVRLLGLREPLEIGRSYPLTLEFALGGVVQADLSVDYEALPA